MGWLFVVTLGLQERRGSAVLRALPAIALGHEASIAVIAGVLVAAQVVTAAALLRPLGAVVLVLFGLFKLVRPYSHPRWVGLRVGSRELVVWSFLMSSAHGAGLMLFPVLLGMPVAAHVEDPLPTGIQDVAAVCLHTLAMLLSMGAVALLVYDRLGVAVLRRAWVNLDAIWAVAVIVAGVATLLT
jgi:hypothetical protein